MSSDMSLVKLPNEILEIIIVYGIPEGFEGLSTTSKRLCALCTPFSTQYNTLRKEFSSVSYYNRDVASISSPRTAYDLIISIAAQPVIARYIRNADFEIDSRLGPRYGGWLPTSRRLPTTNHREEVVDLFATSPYFEIAGLDWRKFHATIEADLQAQRYSQHAAAFLLTLLPSVERLRLPSKWHSLQDTDALVDAVVLQARQNSTACIWPSLAKVITLEPTFALGPGSLSNLGWLNSFLDLPRLRYFDGRGCLAIDGDYDSLQHRTTEENNFNKNPNLEAASLWNCHIDAGGITGFLKKHPNIKTLDYTHVLPSEDAFGHSWDICKFVAAVEKEAARNLQELSISFRRPFPRWKPHCEPAGKSSPRKASLRKFQRLRQLELPLELLAGNLDKPFAALPENKTPNTPLDQLLSHYEIDDHKLSLGQIVPRSVSTLSLISRGTFHHSRVLEILFRNFAIRKGFWLPCLGVIHLSCPHEAHKAYKEQCNRLVSETRRAGVTVQLEEWPFLLSTTWTRDY